MTFQEVAVAVCGRAQHTEREESRATFATQDDRESCHDDDTLRDEWGHSVQWSSSAMSIEESDRSQWTRACCLNFKNAMSNLLPEMAGTSRWATSQQSHTKPRARPPPRY